MIKVVNLNRARKARAREERRREADENAVRFGLSKVEREAAAQERARAEAEHDAKRRE